MADDSATKNKGTFVSKLEKPEQRFLAHVIEHAFEVGRRSPNDFIRHFSAGAVMNALERRPDLRADILVPTTGVNHKVALRKSAGSSGEDLQIALDESVTKPSDVVELFLPDDRVRYLDNRKLWAFVTEGEFWKTDKSKGATFEKAKAHIAFMLDRGLIDNLLSHSDLVGGVSVETLAQSLPREKLGDIINAALKLGRDKKGFTERDLLATAAAAVLVEDVSLVHIWETVLVPKVAEAHGLVEKPTKETKVATAKPAEVKSAAGKSAADSKPADKSDGTPVAVQATRSAPAAGPAPGMPGVQATKSAKAAKKKASKPAAKKAKDDAETSDENTIVETDGKPAGLEELLVDVDDFEIEEIDEDYGDQVAN